MINSSILLFNQHDSNPVEEETMMNSITSNLKICLYTLTTWPRKSWDEVLENERKKLGMDSADPQNRSEWRGHLRERLVKKPNPR